MKIDGLGILDTYQSQASAQKETSETESFKSVMEQAAGSGDMEKLKEACEQFETYFINTLFKQMRSGVSAFSLEEKSQAREYFEGMFDDEISKEMTKSGGIGIADMLYANLKRAYEASEAEAEREAQDAYAPLDLKG